MARFVSDNPEIVSKLFCNRGKVVFSGFGLDPSLCESSDMNRNCTYSINCTDINPKLTIVKEGFETNLRDDTNQIHIAMQLIQEGFNVVVNAQDGDMVQISVLALSQLLLVERCQRKLGNLFIQGTKQTVVKSEDEKYEEEYINITMLTKSIINHKKLVTLDKKHRVPSIVALLILGGDTTSYLFLPLSDGY